MKWKTTYISNPDDDGRCAVYFWIFGEWVHKGWLMPPVVND